MKPRSFFLIQLLLFVVIFSMTFHAMYDHFMDATKEAAGSNSILANRIATITKDRHKSIIGILQSYATRPLLIDAVNRKDLAAVNRHLDSMKKNNPELNVVFIADRKGVLLVSLPYYPEAIGKNLSYRDWYKGVGREWKPYVSGVFKSSAEAGNTVVAIAVPIIGEKGKPIGILSAGQLTLNFGNFLKDFISDDIAKVTLIDQSGNIIYTNQLPYEKKIMKYHFAISSDTITSSAVVKEFMWTVVVEKNRGAILASLSPHFMQIAVASLVLYLFVGFVLAFLRKRVVFKQAFALLAAEERIRDSEERCRLVIERTGKLVYDFDIASKTVKLSGAIQEVTGYEPGEVEIDRDFWKGHIHPDDREPVTGFLTNVVKSGMSNYRIQYRFRRKDGSYIHVEDSGVALNDLKGKTCRVLAVMKDVTYQWQAERNQKLAIEVLKVLNRSNDLTNIIRDILKLFKEYTDIEAIAIRLREGDDYPYYVYDGFSDDFIEKERSLCARDGRNNIICDAEGKPRLECICGYTLSGLADPSYAFFTENGSFWTNSTTQLPVPLIDGDRLGTMRNRCMREGYESVALIPLKSNGEVIGLLQLNDRREGCFMPGFIGYLEGIASSIGVALRRLQSEEKLKENETKYRSIFENSIEGIFQTAPEGHFVSVNPAMARIHGFASPEEMIAGVANIGEQLYVNPDDRKRYKAILEAQGKAEGFEAEVYRKDKSTIWTSTNARAVKDGSGKVLYEGTVLDITERKQAEENQRIFVKELKDAFEGIVTALGATTEMRDPYTSGHQKRVAQLACAIAQEMGFPEEKIGEIRIVGLLHDIGKMGVPAEILSKPAKLTEYEFNIIRVHSMAGYDILKDIKFTWPVADIVLQHHERLDGSGYPQALKNGNIIFEAKIIGVADVVEAMVSHRPYRPALGIDSALDEIKKNSGRLYDKEVVDACARLFREKGFRFE